MKKILLLAFAALLFCGCSATKRQARNGDAPRVARVTDAHFRQYLLEQKLVKPYKGPMRKYGLFVPRSEMVEVTEAGVHATDLNCGRMKVEEVDGLEIFPGLKTLVCGENPIRKLDLGAYPDLQEVIAIETPLTRLDVRQNAKLRMLNVSYTSLRSIDVSGNPELEELYCIFSPGIRRLDLSHNPRLQKLYIRATNIALVDLRSNPDIAAIFASDCPLQYIVVSPQHDLDKIVADVSDATRLLVLEPGAPLPKVDTTALMAVEQLRMPTHSERNEPVVMSFSQAEAQGISVEELRRRYLPAFDYNTETKKFSQQSIIGSEDQMLQLQLTLQMFQQGFVEALNKDDVCLDGFYCIMFCAEDGYVEYFLYNIFDDKKSDLDLQRRMNRALRGYFEETPFGFYAYRPFSQCSTVHVKDKPDALQEQ